MSIIEDRLPLLETVKLERGSHDPNGRFCAMELAAHLAGEPWSHRPDCVSPTISTFMVSWNDAMDDNDRQILLPVIPKLIGTKTTKADEETRAWMATDWLARECVPAWLRLAGLTEHAELLENLVPYTSTAIAQSNQKTLAAAGDAAWAAAGDAARAAAWDAAGAAAGAAAGDAAGAAAGAAFRQTVEVLQVSALKLVERMADVGR